jgi:hypothetical protein
MHLHEVISKNLILGDPFTVHGLGIIPLLGDTALDLPPIDLLERALDGGTLKITEVSEGGSVPFLRAENNGSKPVLILDGEELTGGKQNRIVNTTIIIAAETSIKIPVSCVEAGRWNRRREDFASGEALFRAKSRAVQKAGVTMSLRMEGNFRSDQGQVWREVDESLSELRVHSPTSNFTEGREQVSHRIEEFVDRIRPVDRQVGAVFFSPAGVLGAELLGTRDLFAASLAKIVRSFAFEVLSVPGFETVQPEPVKNWWEKVLEASLAGHPSPGAGEDVRIDARDLIGSGLLWNNTLIHFSCFPGEEARPSRETNSRRASVGERRNRQRNR